MEFVSLILPMAVGSVDRLEEIPDRLRFLFEFDAAGGARHARGRRGDGRAGRARGRGGARRRACATSGRLDRDAFRAAAARVKQRTGQKGRALFHPIRVALTGEAGGPELDLAVPAIDRGAELPRSAGVALVLGCRERAEMFARTVR